MSFNMGKKLLHFASNIEAVEFFRRCATLLASGHDVDEFSEFADLALPKISASPKKEWTKWLGEGVWKMPLTSQARDSLLHHSCKAAKKTGFDIRTFMLDGGNTGTDDPVCKSLLEMAWLECSHQTWHQPKKDAFCV